MKTRASVACLFTLALFLTVSCSKDSDHDDTETESNASASAVGSVAGGNVTGSGTRFSELLGSYERAECQVKRCSAIAFGACTNRERRKNFSTDGGNDCPCVRKSSGNLFDLNTDRGLVRLFGTVTLGFSSATCDMTNAGEKVTRTLTNFHVRRGRNGRLIAYYTGTGTVAGITISDSELKDFEGNSHSGGGTLTRDSDADTFDELTIAGIHRAGFTPKATAFSERKLFQSLFTDTGALIKVKRDTTNHKVTLGVGSQWTVMRNILKVREDWEVLADLVFEYDKCDHPTSGRVRVKLKEGTSRDFDYSGKSCDDFDKTED